MGSNQGKQPHHADRGGKVWSRDEKRENRRTMRAARTRDAINDNVSSHGKGIECPCGCGHYQACNDYLGVPEHRRPTPPKKHRKDTRRWCRGKVDQEHDPQFVQDIGLPRYYSFKVFACSRCGKRTYERTRRA